MPLDPPRHLHRLKDVTWTDTPFWSSNCRSGIMSQKLHQMPVFRCSKHTLEMTNSMEAARIFAFLALRVMQQITFLFFGTAYIIKPHDLMRVHSVSVAFFPESEAIKHPNQVKKGRIHLE